MIKKILVGLFVCFSIQPIISQNTFSEKYDFGILFSSEFYNAEFKTIVELDSKEIYCASLGLMFRNKENKNYTSLEFRLLRNYSDMIKLNGYSIYASTNYNVLKKSKKHLLYPKIGLGIDKYTLKINQELSFEGNNILLKSDKLKSNYSTFLSAGIGYEYLFGIKHKILSDKVLRFSLGLNFEKSTFINNQKWELEGSGINYFKTDLVHGIKTKIVVRLFF